MEALAPRKAVPPAATRALIRRLNAQAPIISTSSRRDWATVVNLNLTANWRLLRSLDRLLRASDAGRAIFVTDSLAREARAYWGAYAATKAALETLVLVYADEIANTKVRVNLIDPGPLRTALRARAYPGEKPEALPSPDSVTDAFVALAETACTDHGTLTVKDR